MHEYEAAGVIERCKSPWCSPVVLAKKSDGSWRMYIDFRMVNTMTKKYLHPIPNIDKSSKYRARPLSKINLISVFLQIPISEHSRDITAFSVSGRGQYRFRAVIDIEFVHPRASEHIFAYLNNIGIASETFEEHIYWLEVLLNP